MKNLIIQKNINKIIISFVLIFVSLFSVFPAGSLLISSRKEENAYKLASTAQTQTINGEYLSVLVESKDENVSHLNMPYSEFYSLYGAFRESKITFAGTVNADKTNIITINEIPTNNLSFLYSNVFSNKEYNGHYKHEYYPIELMFKGVGRVEGDYSFCYLSQSQADLYLNYLGLDSSPNNYQSILGKTIHLNINNESFPFTIGNIYYEQNYYYFGLTDVIGEFLISYITYPSPLKRQACYFMRQYPFQNIFYIDRINSLYEPSNFVVKINHYNISSQIDDISLTDFFYGQKDYASNGIGITLLVFISINYFFALFLFFRYKAYTNKYLMIAMSGAILIPYIFYKLLFKYAANVVMFSHVSCLLNFMFVAAFYLMLVIILLNYIFSKRRNKLVSYEKIDC